MADIVSRTLSVHQEHEFLGKLEAVGLTADDAQRVIQSKGNALAEKVLVVIRESPSVEVFTLSVNYGQRVEKLLKAGGYDWEDDSLTSKNFPPTRRKTDTVRLYLIHFNRVIIDGEVTRKLEQLKRELNLRDDPDATIEELFTLGANPKTRDLQRQFAIVARGSVWQDSDGSRHVPALWSDDGERYAYLGWLDRRWGSDYRFLVVGK